MAAASAYTFANVRNPDRLLRRFLNDTALCPPHVRDKLKIEDDVRERGLADNAVKISKLEKIRGRLDTNREDFAVLQNENSKSADDHIEIARLGREIEADVAEMIAIQNPPKQPRKKLEDMSPEEIAEYRWNLAKSQIVKEWLGEELLIPDTAAEHILQFALKKTPLESAQRKVKYKKPEELPSLMAKRLDDYDSKLREIHGVKSAPLPMEQQLAQAFRFLDRRATPIKVDRLRRERPISSLAKTLKQGELEIPYFTASDGRTSFRIDDAMGVLLWAFGDQIKEKLRAMIEADTRPTITRAERTAKLEVLFEELLECQRQIEAVGREMIAHGLEYVRPWGFHPLARFEIQIAEFEGEPEADDNRYPEGTSVSKGGDSGTSHRGNF